MAGGGGGGSKSVLLVSLLRALGLAGGLESSGCVIVGESSAPGFAVAAAVAVAVAPGAVAVAVAVAVAWTCCTLGWLVWVVGPAVLVELAVVEPAVAPAVVVFCPVVGVGPAGFTAVLVGIGLLGGPFGLDLGKPGRTWGWLLACRSIQGGWGCCPGVVVLLCTVVGAFLGWPPVLVCFCWRFFPVDWARGLRWPAVIRVVFRGLISRPDAVVKPDPVIFDGLASWASFFVLGLSLLLLLAMVVDL
jgi:hypothetical protein